MKRRFRLDHPASELPMTSLIDVVFLLLVFFLLSAPPPNVLAHLNVLRPSGAPGPDAPALRLEIQPDGYTLNARPVTESELRHHLVRLGSLDPDQMVVMVSGSDAAHSRLVQALDICSEAGLTRISVLSAAPPRDDRPGTP